MTVRHVENSVNYVKIHLLTLILPSSSIGLYIVPLSHKVGDIAHYTSQT